MPVIIDLMENPRQFCGQWDSLVHARAEEVEVTLRIEKEECTVLVRQRDLYVISPNADVRYIDVVEDREGFVFSAPALNHAIHVVSEYAGGPRPPANQRALVVFAISEAARFAPFRVILYGLHHGGRSCNWTKLRGIMNNWAHIRHVLGRDTFLTALSLPDLYIAQRRLQYHELTQSYWYLESILPNKAPAQITQKDSTLQCLSGEQQYKMCYFGQENPVEQGVLPDGSNTYVGQGINVVTATGPNVESLKPALFIPEVYKTGDVIHTSQMNLSESASQASDDFTEVFQSSEISSELKTGAGLVFFSGGISAKYGTSGKLEQSAKFYSAIASAETAKHAVAAPYLLPEGMRRIIHPIVQKYIDDPATPPRLLFEVYGTHIVSAASIGGCIQVNGVYKSEKQISNSEFQAAIDLGCSYISAHAEGKATQEQQRIISSTSIHCKSYGGDVTVAASMHSFDEISKAFKAWAESIRAKGNQVLSKVYAYRPLWDLAQKVERREEIKNAFIELAMENYATVSQYFQISIPMTISTPLRTLEGELLVAFMLLPGLNEYIRPSAMVKLSPGFIFEKIPYPDGTVCFRSQASGRYVGVCVSPGGRERNWLYANCTAIEDRQRFMLEVEAKRYRIRSCYNGMYVTARREDASIHFVANGTKAEALLFEMSRV